MNNFDYNKNKKIMPYAWEAKGTVSVMGDFV